MKARFSNTLANGVVLLGEAVTPWMLVCGLVIVLGTTFSTGLWHLPAGRRELSS